MNFNSIFNKENKSNQNKKNNIYSKKDNQYHVFEQDLLN